MTMIKTVLIVIGIIVGIIILIGVLVCLFGDSSYKKLTKREIISDDIISTGENITRITVYKETWDILTGCDYSTDCKSQEYINCVIETSIEGNIIETLKPQLMEIKKKDKLVDFNKIIIK